MPTIQAKAPRRPAVPLRRKAGDYEKLVRALADRAQEWAAPDWSVTQEETELNDAQLGNVTVPVTTIETPKGRLMLEPLGLSIGKNAIVDFYAWPALYRVRLLHNLTDTGAWRVRTDSGIYLNDLDNGAFFVALGRDLLAADWD